MMVLMPWIKLLRPTQWLKNLMLFFPPFLGGTFFHAGVLTKGISPLIAFCLASSAIYIINDIADATADACHPKKKHRPIPAGCVGKYAAATLSCVLLVSAILISPPGVKPWILAYMAVSIIYSLRLKDFVLIDLFCISAGFLLRLQAGGAVFNIHISEWLFLSVFLLSLFLSTGKRLAEKNVLGKESGTHRKSLAAYPDGYLEGAMYLTGATVLVTYTMYVISHGFLIYSVPLCAFGLLRYSLRVKSGMGGDPTDSLLRDGQLLVVGLSWALMVGWETYGR